MDMTPSRFLTAAVAATLLGLGAAACGTQAGNTASQTPGKQHQAGTVTPSPRISAQPFSSSSVVPGVPSWAQLTLTGKLPASGPATGSVYQLPSGAVPAATVAVLAGALHISGAPQRVAGGWRASGPGTLQIADASGQHWTFAGLNIFQPPCGPVLGGPVRSGTTGLAARAAQPRAATFACPVKPGQVEPYDPLPLPRTTGTPPSVAAAEAAAMPVLQAVGLAGAPLRTATIGSYTFVSADPVVDGLATTGFATSIGVGPGGRIVLANGWLGHGVPGGSYPLISAQQAFDKLKLSTHPTGRPPELMCPLSPDVVCGMSRPLRVIEVTGALYGLALSYSHGQPVLTPSWLFSFTGSGLRIPGIAINPRYLTG